ncbi:Hypothetical predicted protein [Pelobates cultripes]|uniref:Uncharacterized protein n=1 Tax=Pelobates cultripes TaxID=61616 RepID=A0AAD1T1G0_PELCU|nr:Hypothetical predicted protein [Pelobates cultripes]
MDGYLSAPDDLRATRWSDKMASYSPVADSTADSQCSLARSETLTQISAELAAISANMLTICDKEELVTELQATIQEVRRDLTALKSRVDDLEAEHPQAEHTQQAAELATAQQGNVLLELRMQVEDLDNRGWRNNIHIRGLPEKPDEALSLFMGLFTQRLGDSAPDDFGIE